MMSSTKCGFTIHKAKFHGQCIRVPPMPMNAASLRESLCDRFMLAQDATGLSKGEFAAAVGLTPSQLTNIKRYRNPPSHEAIYRAVREFGFTADWFYEGTKSGFRDPTLADRLRAAEAHASLKG